MSDSLPKYDASRPCVKCGRVGTTDAHKDGLTAVQAERNRAWMLKDKAEHEQRVSVWAEWRLMDRKQRRAWLAKNGGREPMDPRWLPFREWTYTTKPHPPWIERVCACGYGWPEAPMDYDASANIYGENPK